MIGHMPAYVQPDEDDWRHDAACKGLGDLFYPPRPWPAGGPDYGPALAVCAACPVRADCHAWARSVGEITAKGIPREDCVVGGVAPPVRVSKHTGRPVAAPRPCGTRAAYERHVRHGEEPCEDCKAARDERDRARNAATSARRRSA